MMLVKFLVGGLFIGVVFVIDRVVLSIVVGDYGSIFVGGFFVCYVVFVVLDCIQVLNLSF